MTNPPNQPRDDRRMHEGRKPGLDETEDKGGTATIDHEKSADDKQPKRKPSENTDFRDSWPAGSFAIHRSATE